MRNRCLVAPPLVAFVLLILLIAACSSDDDGGDQLQAAASGGAPGSAIGVALGYQFKQTFDMPIEITSDVFGRIRRLKIEYTCLTQRNLTLKGDWEAGLDKSPPFRWTGVPDGTVSLALVMDDPDVIDVEADVLNAKVHWVMWNLPPDTTELPEHIATTTEIASLGPNVRQGTNDFDVTGYTGPCPSLSTISIGQSGGTYDPMSHIYTGIRVLPHGYVIKLYALDIELDLPAGATKDQLLEAMDGHILAGGQATAEYRPKSLRK